MLLVLLSPVLAVGRREGGVVEREEGVTCFKTTGHHCK